MDLFEFLQSSAASSSTEVAHVKNCAKQQQLRVDQRGGAAGKMVAKQHQPKVGIG